MRTGLRGTLAILAGLGVVTLPGPVTAFDFDAGKDFSGYWNNTIAAGVALRGHDADYQLVGFNNANQYKGAFGAISVVDDSNLNYPHAGDLVAAPFTLVSDLNLLYLSRYGAFVRARAWYDVLYSTSDVPHGNVPNGYVPGARLSDSGFRMPNKFLGAEITDAFLQGSFALGEVDLFVRVGRQVVNWGEGQLYTGINSFNPIDATWLLRPGGGVLDGGFLPVGRILASAQFPGGFTLEGFFDFEWVRSNLPGCGMWGNFLDSGFETSCNKATPAVPYPDQLILDKGLAIGSLNNASASAWGQFGLAARYFVEPIATQLAAYYVRFNSSNPSVNISHASTPSAIEVQTVYPQGIQEIALSVSSGVRNYTFYGEFLATIGLPGQRNFPTLIEGAVNHQGPYAAGIEATPLGSFFLGYDTLNMYQLLFGGNAQFSPGLGIQNLLLSAEANVEWLPDLPSTDQERIARFGNFGSASYNGSCQGGYNVCEVAGFATRWVFGYRLRAQATAYLSGSAIAFIPALFFGQDVAGYAMDLSMVQGRVVFGASLRVTFLQLIFAQATGTWYRLNTEFDPLRDKSTYSFSTGVTF